MTDAHDQKRTISLIEHVPQHEPRITDPHYHLFHQARMRIINAGLWKCAVGVGPHSEQLELHHSKVEFSLQGGVDLARFNEYYGLHLADDEAFRAYIEGEGGLEVLCTNHHRTRFGVHLLPEPEWVALRVWRDDIAPPAEAKGNI